MSSSQLLLFNHSLPIPKHSRPSLRGRPRVDLASWVVPASIAKWRDADLWLRRLPVKLTAGAPRLLTAWVALSILAVATRWTSAGAAAAPATLTVVGQSSLGARGMNAALTVSGGCGYVGSRNDAAGLIVDVSSPSSPQVIGR